MVLHVTLLNSGKHWRGFFSKLRVGTLIYSPHRTPHPHRPHRPQPCTPRNSQPMLQMAQMAQSPSKTALVAQPSSSALLRQAFLDSVEHSPSKTALSFSLFHALAITNAGAYLGSCRTPKTVEQQNAFFHFAAWPFTHFVRAGRLKLQHIVTLSSST